MNLSIYQYGPVTGVPVLNCGFVCVAPGGGGVRNGHSGAGEAARANAMSGDLAPILLQGDDGEQTRAGGAATRWVAISSINEEQFSATRGNAALFALFVQIYPQLHLQEE
jgi:hypothetical protein